ncbi:unnamed protein product [Rotaria sp. Silwood1]|nr:unnamed protein product [Rotaria sp. Silwood1]CAF1581763.1 unnamed protein product [Rotaria sp. Silwood1]
MADIDGKLFTKVYHKPSHKPYYLPYNSVHPIHIKKNIIFTMLLRTIRYCSTFEAYVHERESLRMAFLLNKYSNKCIDEQFNKTWSKFYIHETIDYNNYDRLRQKIIEHPEKEKTWIDYNKIIYLKNYPVFIRINVQYIWNIYMNNSNKIVKNLLDIQLIILTLLSRPIIFDSAKMNNLCTLDIKLTDTYEILLTKAAYDDSTLSLFCTIIVPTDFHLRYL